MHKLRSATISTSVVAYVLTVSKTTLLSTLDVAFLNAIDSCEGVGGPLGPTQPDCVLLIVLLLAVPDKEEVVLFASTSSSVLTSAPSNACTAEQQQGVGTQ
jgi:hypothetical protein